MRFRLVGLVAVPAAVAFAACGDDAEDVFGPAPMADAGQEADDAEAGTDSGQDAGKSDAGDAGDGDAAAADATDDVAELDAASDALSDVLTDASDATPEFLSCDGLAEGHLVIKIVAPADKPSATRLAMDGWIASKGQDLTTPSWRGLYIAPTTSSQAAADLSTQPIGLGGVFIGPMSSGTKAEFNPGYNVGADLAASPVVDSGYLCQGGVCQGSILACYGEKEIGRTINGNIFGALEVIGATGANIKITTP